mgnify:CR=1 FL=1
MYIDKTCKWCLGKPHEIPIDSVLHCPKCCGFAYWVERGFRYKEQSNILG